MLNLIQNIAIRIRTREEGQTFVEYGLVIGVVSIGLLTAFAGLGGAIGGVVDTIIAKLAAAAA